MFKRKAKVSTSGYIYIASNAAMPGLVKIGMTSKHPSKRLADLYNTSVPVPFTLQYFLRVSDRYKSERELHLLFAQDRVSKKREFFAVPVEVAIQRAEARIPHLKNSPHRSFGSHLKRLFWLAVAIALIVAAFRYGYVEPTVDFLKMLLNTLLSSRENA